MIVYVSLKTKQNKKDLRGLIVFSLKLICTILRFCAFPFFKFFWKITMHNRTERHYSQINEYMLTATRTETKNPVSRSIWRET